MIGLLEKEQLSEAIVEGVLVGEGKKEEGKERVVVLERVDALDTAFAKQIFKARRVLARVARSKPMVATREYRWARVRQIAEGKISSAQFQAESLQFVVKKIVTARHELEMTVERLAQSRAALKIVMQRTEGVMAKIDKRELGEWEMENALLMQVKELLRTVEIEGVRVKSAMVGLDKVLNGKLGLAEVVAVMKGDAVDWQKTLEYGN